MFEEYEHVRIKKTGIMGIIVDKSERDGKIYYIIESDEKGVSGGWWEADKDAWSLFDCTEDELERVD